MTLDSLPAGVEALVEWNNEHDVAWDIRIMKLAEETGEAMQAWMGYNGYNPRKGYTHDLAGVLSELADVTIAGCIAIASLDPGRLEQHLIERLQFVCDRLGLEVTP
jgi:NTP pyrophosphatase (non-canonical NTP hydrolase)